MFSVEHVYPNAVFLLGQAETYYAAFRMAVRHWRLFMHSPSAAVTRVRVGHRAYELHYERGRKDFYRITHHRTKDNSSQ